MWIMLKDAFISVVDKDCLPTELLVRARRAGDLERLFGKRVKITRSTDTDYLYRVIVKRRRLIELMTTEILNVGYRNFKSAVKDDELHSAYLNVWEAMAAVQHPRPYSGAK